MRYLPTLRRLVSTGGAAALVVALLGPTAASALERPQPPSDVDPTSKIVSSLTLADGSQAQVVKDRWFVQLRSPAVADGGSASAIKSEQDEITKLVKDVDTDAEVTSTFSTLWNGVAVDIQDDKIDDLAKLDQVATVQPVVVIPRPEENAAHGADADNPSEADKQEGLSEPQMRHALGLTGADIAQSELGYTGEGVKIGIIDSGVDYDHVEFGGSGSPGPAAATGDGSASFPTSKVIAGYDFVGNSYGDPAVAEEERYKRAPDAYPDDCGGHGTHVAGIAAAKGAPGTEQITGVAPDAQLGAYRVFGCSGDTDSEVMAAAMERAATDGMDVVNISIGADYMLLKDYPTTLSAENLAARGVIVTVAQGNVGEVGRWSMSAPAGAQHVLAVGSVDNTVETNFYLSVSTNPDQKFRYVESSDDPVRVKRDPSVKTPLVAAGNPAADGGDAADDPSVLCQAPQAGAFMGKSVLIRRGHCPFRQKILNAQTGGAVGVVVDDNVKGATGSISVAGGPEAVTVPVVSLSMDDGDAIRSALADGSELFFSDGPAEFDIASGGRVSSFSSWGLNESLDLKPDLSAPGGRILSTWPLENGPYKSTEGTSMAAPYAAGVVALVLQAHPEIKDETDTQAFEQMAWRLRSTADPVVWNQAADGDTSSLEPVSRQGAGLIDADGAIQATVEADPSVINVGQSARYPDGYTAKVTLTNHTNEPLTYTLSHQDAVTITGVSATPERGTTSPSTVSTDSSSVTIPESGSTDVEVTIKAPEGISDGDFFGGWIVLTPSGDATAEPVRVPFSGVGGLLAKGGLFGSQTALYNLDRKPVDPETYVFGNSEFSDQGVYEDLPAVVIEPNIPYRGSSMSVSRVADDGTVQYLGAVRADLAPYVRKDVPNFVWNGGYLNGHGEYRQAPTGKYQLTVRALPVGCDGDDPEEWATWTSPTFAIDWRTQEYIPQKELTVTSPDGATALTDDDVFTSVDSGGTNPYTADIDLGSVREVTKVQYTPDQFKQEKHASNVSVQTSVDGTTWSDAEAVDVKTETFSPTAVVLKNPTQARYVRVTVSGTDAFDVAELRVAEAAKDDDGGGDNGGNPGDPGKPGDGGANPGDPGATGDATGGATAPASDKGLGDLARTGASIGLGLVAVVLVIGGVLLVVVRRRRNKGDGTDASGGASGASGDGGATGGEG